MTDPMTLRAPLIERLRERLKNATDSDRKYERPMNWTEADELLAMFDAAPALAAPPSATIEGLRKALEPFSKMADQVDAWQTGTDQTFPGEFHAEDLRHARAALKASEPK